MSIISNPKENFCKFHFIFMGNQILLCNKGENETFDIKNLPSANDLNKFLENQIVSDWFSETQLDYTAFFLEKDASLPNEFFLISLRQFMWESKTQNEKQNFVPSKISSLACRAHSLLELRATYRFCPSCGGKLIDDNFFTAKKCAICGKQLFPRLEPAIIVLVSKGDEVLLVKNKNRTRDVYSCVAGFVEAGESAEQCVEREVMEETGIKIQNVRYIKSQSWPFPDQLMLAFRAEYLGGKIKIQEEELEDAAWFNKNSLPPLPFEGSVAYNLISTFMAEN